MRRIRHHIVARALLVAALIAIALGVRGGLATSGAQARTVRQACAATEGTYAVGAVSGATPRAGVIPANPFVGGLSGTITLKRVPACGGAFAGSFAVHARRELVPVPQPRGQAGSSSVAVTVPGVPVATTVLTATGTFGADPAHPGISSYVVVSGTVTYGHLNISCAPPGGAPPTDAMTGSVAAAGCGAPRPTVTSVATFSAVTGYVRAQGGTPPTLTLAFLPPPDVATAATSGAAFQALVLVGRRTGS